MYLLGLCTERFRMQESGQTTTLASSMRIRFISLAETVAMLDLLRCG